MFNSVKLSFSHMVILKKLLYVCYAFPTVKEFEIWLLYLSRL